MHAISAVQPEANCGQAIEHETESCPRTFSMGIEIRRWQIEVELESNETKPVLQREQMIGRRSRNFRLFGLRQKSVKQKGAPIVQSLPHDNNHDCNSRRCELRVHPRLLYDSDAQNSAGSKHVGAQSGPAAQWEQTFQQARTTAGVWRSCAACFWIEPHVDSE